MVDPLSYFSFQQVLNDWCNKGCGMCYTVSGIVHIKEPLLLIGNNSLCGSSRFPLSLSKWSFTMCQTPYNSKCNVLSASLNKTFPSLPDPLSYFSFQPVLHDWCNKGCGMCYPVCGKMHIKEPFANRKE